MNKWIDKYRLCCAALAIGFFSIGAAVAETIADPTKPLHGGSARVTSAETLNLQAVFWRESGSAAIINGKQVQRGDRVDQYRVVAIREKSVVLERNGQNRVLKLRQSIYH